VGCGAIRQLLIDTDKASLGVPSVTYSVLKQRTLDRFGVGAPLDLLTVRVVREGRLSQLSPLVFEAAFGDGDPFALRILQTCASFRVAHTPSSPFAQRLVRACAQGCARIRERRLLWRFVGRHRDMILDTLKDERMGGHVFKYVEYVDDAAKIGAEGLAAAGAEWRRSGTSCGLSLSRYPNRHGIRSDDFPDRFAGA